MKGCFYTKHSHNNPLCSVGIQSFADMYSCTELESVARRYIYSHFLDVIQHDEFLQLTSDRFIELLKSDQLQVNTEEQVGHRGCISLRISQNSCIKKMVLANIQY